MKSRLTVIPAPPVIPAEAGIQKLQTRECLCPQAGRNAPWDNLWGELRGSGGRPTGKSRWIDAI